jgi:uncharacterized protein YlxP (DUF503 family)
MATGYVGILTAELHFPDNGSLKGKRRRLKSAKDQLQERFGVAVAEVDHHEAWQRSRLTVACVAREHRELRLAGVRVATDGAGGGRPWRVIDSGASTKRSVRSSRMRFRLSRIPASVS